MADYIALIRRASSPPIAVRSSPADEPASGGDDDLVFLHGDGVAAAVGNGTAGAFARAHVCRTSWRRRFGSVPPDPPFVESSLAAFYTALAEARRIDSHGLGGSACSFVAGGRRAASGVLIEFGFAPESEHAAAEALELALAAAALDVRARILFSAGGELHLTGRRGRAWRQLTDFDLLPLFAAAPAKAGEHAAPARALDAAGVTRLYRDAGAIVLG